MVLARLEKDAVARPDDLDRTALALAQADTFGDRDRLTVRVGMPRSSRAWREVHAGCADARVLGRHGDGVDVYGAGEPVARAAVRVEGVSRDLQRFLLPPRFRMAPGSLRPIERVLPGKALPGKDPSPSEQLRLSDNEAD